MSAQKRRRGKVSDTSGDDLPSSSALLDDSPAMKKSKRIKADRQASNQDPDESGSEKEAEKFHLPLIAGPSPFELPPAKNALQRTHQEECFDCGREIGDLGHCQTCVGK